ncbi:TIR domain-containing protein [Streptosporangium sp. NPDC051022]|uniref:toll/interleukin-1 receptor domain-containing protein n=1 Tax=Streptosporangium sp. NPDC051022 TaxID=3155752 RepID=UPI003437F268
MDVANLAVAVISAVAGVAGAYFAWIPVRRLLSDRRAPRPQVSPTPPLPAPASPTPVSPTPTSPTSVSRPPASGTPSPGDGASGDDPAATAYDVFVSYSHDDADLVTELAGRLERRGVRVAYDRVLVRPGSIVLHEIERAIRDSAHGLLVFSPASMASGPVMNEYYALLRKSVYGGRLLIPVLAADVRDEELPEFVRIRFCSDLRGASDTVFDRRVEEIAEAVRRAASP